MNRICFAEQPSYHESDVLSLPLKEGWNKISDDYQQRMEIPTDDICWGDFVATESRLGVLGEVRGKRILEIGCGAAQNSLVLSKWGAHAFGIDLSRRQILHGRQLSRKEAVEVNLLVGSIDSLPFKDETFDMIIAARTLHYVPDLKAAISEVHRVLVEKGCFTINTVHPLIWGSAGKLAKYRGKPAVTIRNYFERRVVRWINKLPNGTRVKMHSYYQTLQDHFDILIQNGFTIERYMELERLHESALHPLNQEKLKKDKKARQFYTKMKEVPYWVIIKARK